MSDWSDYLTTSFLDRLNPTRLLTNPRCTFFHQVTDRRLALVFWHMTVHQRKFGNLRMKLIRMLRKHLLGHRNVANMFPRWNWFKLTCCGITCHGDKKYKHDKVTRLLIPFNYRDKKTVCIKKNCCVNLISEVFCHHNLRQQAYKQVHTCMYTG